MQPFFYFWDLKRVKNSILTYKNQRKLSEYQLTNTHTYLKTSGRSLGLDSTIALRRCVEAVGASKGSAMTSVGAAGAAAVGTAALGNTVAAFRVPPPEPSY